MAGHQVTVTPVNKKRAVESAIQAFATQPLREAGLALLDTLGYRSDLTLRVSGLKEFRDHFDPQGKLRDEAAKTTQWKNIEFLRQVAGEDISLSGQGALPFQRNFKPTEVQSYVFLAIELEQGRYTRKELAEISRAVNRVFAMPAMLLLRHGTTISLAIINRRPHRRDEEKDVLEKVTLIKDISTVDPHRAHIEILHDLSIDVLHAEFSFHNFAELQQAWEKRLDSDALNRRFYREVANWYFWALGLPNAVLPRSIEAIAEGKERDKQRSLFFIRLLTRVIFCWFLQEKGLLPRDLFRRRVAAEILKDFSPSAGTYYQAVLQNLFFATLNQEQDKRAWRKKYIGSRDGNRGITTLWRYQDLVKDPEKLESLFRDHIPFVNGGLFDCLDDPISTPRVRFDDFSEEKENGLRLSNELFFGEEREVDLSAAYEDGRHRKDKVRGLVEILSRYKFTVEENTPLEQEIALDPELLGKVFENLLASYNEDTKTTARKALGAYYTPREIVVYMVDEALRSYLAAEAPSVPEAALRSLFAPHDKMPRLSQSQTEALVKAIGSVKILDPACGSGAFPMGALHRLVDLLRKLDPNNELWKRDRLAEANDDRERAEDVRRSFDAPTYSPDFARKLYLIENCIYGVDIQPIACLIAKLRFFIALIVDQDVDPSSPNLGIRPLPNLETKIVAADTLMGIQRPRKMPLRNVAIEAKEAELRRVRVRHFGARSPETKAKYREQDTKLRAEIATLLEGDEWDTATARKLTAWDPYDQNSAAGFFDPEWMFGLPVGTEQTDRKPSSTLRGRMLLVNEAGGQTEMAELGAGERESGFDVVIGNPPYVRIQTLKQQDPERASYYKEHYEAARKGNYDLYVVFVEAGLKFLKKNGHLAYILPHKFFNAQYGQPLRGLLAKGRQLQHVVHFGDQQVFPGVTNYVCLLFLAKAGADACRFVRADDLDAWRQTFKGVEGSFSAGSITAADWNFAVGGGSAVFERLRSHSLTLGQISAGISQGIRTSANEVYVLDVRSEDGKFVRAHSKQLNREVILERQAVSQFLQGKEIKPFCIQYSGKVVVIPYRERGGRASLIPLSELARAAPKVHTYLIENKETLEAREDGRMVGVGWYGFIYPKNIGVMSQPKLLVPDIAARASFALDEKGEFAFASGYGITLGANAGISLGFLLGLANSHVLDFFWRKVSTPLRGGFYRYFSQFIEKLPIARGTSEQQDSVTRLVGYLVWLNEHFSKNAGATTARDPLMLGYWEQILNGLVYELYFPAELHARGLHVFNLAHQAGLPELNAIPETTRLTRLRSEFERVYDLQHPLRTALHELQTVEEVRVIEGKA